MNPVEQAKSLASMAPARKAFSLWEEFRSFAFKGNVIDLAVGVIIGAAFGDIVKSLVANIIMPVISLLIPSDQAYNDWVIPLFGGKTMPVGLFIKDVINFIIVAFALYLFIVKFLGWLTRAKQEEAAAPPPLTKEQQLLTEIRDLLKGGQATGVPG